MESFQVFWTGAQSNFVLISPAIDVPTTTVNPPIDVYEGCETEKVCFGIPSGCITSGNCNLFGAVIYENERFFFQLLSARKTFGVHRKITFNHTFL